MKVTTTGTAGVFGSLQRHHVLAAGLASLIVVVAISAGAWITDGFSRGTPASATAPAPQVRPESIIYVVRDQAQADLVLQSELDAGRIREAFGLVDAAVKVEIVVAQGPFVDAAIADAIYIRDGVGLPGVDVYDLR
jgi:hypothetical protein